MRDQYFCVEPLEELHKLVGMHKVKTDIVNQIVFFLQGLNRNPTKTNELENDDMLHTVITGPGRW